MDDKALVERVLAWLDGGCSSWNVPSSDIRQMATRIEALKANNARLRLTLQNTAEAVAIWAKKPLQETRQRNPSDQASWDQIAAVVGAMVDAALEGE